MTALQNLSRRTLAACGGTLVLFLLAGCGGGFGPQSTPLVSTTGGSLSGTLIGGANPISGATMSVYATGNTDGTNGGYGIAHQMGASATTDATGKFYFPGPLVCPAGQFAYIVSAGGDTGAGNNNAAVLVAALGRCEDLFTHAHIYVNELTTVAAAYALGHFAGTTTGSGYSTVIQIGAPSTNNAVTGCVANGGSCPTTVAAGLSHAFENAQDLVNAFSNDGASTTLPGNSSALVPAQLINSIGNAVVACVNSSGNTGSSYPCGQLFLATANGGTAPTDTWDAMVDLASNPTLSGSGKPTSYLLNIGSARTNVYFPSLSTAPDDYSIAIYYPQGIGAAFGVQGLQYPDSGALDSNDVFYVANQDQLSASRSNLASFSSDGSLLDFTPDNTNYPNARDVVADALGDIYTTTGGRTHEVLRWLSAAGQISSIPVVIDASVSSPGQAYSSAVDAANNLWFTTTGSTTSNLFEVSSTGTTATGMLLTLPYSRAIAIDPDQNVWLGTFSTTNTGYAVVLQNTGSVSAPVYSAANITTASLPSMAAYGIAFVPNTTPGVPFLAYYSFQKSTAGLAPVTPAFSGAEVTSIASGSIVANAVTKGARYDAADGAGVVWTADYAGGKLIETTHTTSGDVTESVQLDPCLMINTAASSCSEIFGKPNTASIDSAGSIWVTDPNNGSLVQIIGTATPTWPLLSLGKLGRP